MRRGSLLGVVACCLAACHSPVAAAPVAEPEQVRAARILADHFEEVFRDRYAPRALKEKTIGWSLPNELHRLRAVIEQKPAPTTSDLQRAFRGLFQSAHDIHTSIVLPDDNAVWLGIHVLSTNAGVRIAWIDPKLATPLHVGDLVLSIDGKPADEAIRAIAAEYGVHSTTDFERAFGDWFFGLRSTSDLLEMPAAGTSAQLVVVQQDAAPPLPVELRWRDFATDGPSERCPFWPKAKHSVLPPLGRVLWRSAAEAYFEAYAFEANGHRYGFIRLQSYDVPAASQTAAIHHFDLAIDEFRARGVDGLILDQRGNGGGNFLFAYVMLARLFDHPLVPARQRYLVYGDEVVGLGPRSALAHLADELGRPKTNDEARTAMDAIPLFGAAYGFGPRDLRAAHDAASFFGFFASQPAGLTAPHFVLAPEFTSDPSRGAIFSKPVLMLVDGMSISAADYVPATLQDNGRATIFGTTTSGGGGDQRHVGLDDACTPERVHRLVSACAPASALAALKALGFTGYNYTVTLGVRPGERVLENVGTVPDVPYRIKLEDLTKRFGPMRALILETLNTR